MNDHAAITDPLFHTFRAPDAEGGVVRSYAHTWCQAAAIAHVVEAFAADPTPGRIVLVMAQHHNDGDRVSARYELYREGDAIRVASTGGDRELATLAYGSAHAASDLAFYLLGCKRDGDIIFRQP